MLTLHDVAYAHPNRDVLFTDIQLILNDHAKAALVGNNGTGKSTLLKIMAGLLRPVAGYVKADSVPYYVPQLFDRYNGCTVAQALGVDQTVGALQQILAGQVTEQNLSVLGDDWGIEERCYEALVHWGLEGLDLNQSMDTLSGGQKTKVLLAGIWIHHPDTVLLDEPSNHLDAAGRQLLYEYIRSTKNTLLVVSHDRRLLNLLDTVYELDKRGITTYGGNYDFYAAQKQIEAEALNQDVKSVGKALRKARETERESMERKQKLDARGKKKQEKAGLPTISMNTFKNNAEKSTARLKGALAEKAEALAKELQQLRQELPGTDKMKLDFDNSQLHKGKTLVRAEGLNVNRKGHWLWKEGLSFQLLSGMRLALKGANGSGKTTLLRLMLGDMQPDTGRVDRVPLRAIYIDQDYSLLNHALSVYELAQRYNSGAMQEHEIKTRLSRFLFTKANWDKPCSALSGGEKMRLLLCALSIGRQAPDLIVLDEPTNNLDMQNKEMLTAAINDYEGTLVVVSHDDYFLEQIGVATTMTLRAI